MLKVTEHGVNITLTGKSHDDGMFWFAVALLVGSLAVVLAMSFLSIKLAIGALTLLILGSYVFNLLRQKQKLTSQLKISSGMIDVRSGMLIHHDGMNQHRVLFQVSDCLDNHGHSLTIYDVDGNKKCHLSGFESTKEVEIMQQVLQGKALTKRNANIKMKSTK